MGPVEGQQRRLFRLRVEAESSGERLDHYMARSVPELSRTLARRLVEIGGVHLSGRRVRRCSQPVKEGEAIEIHIDGLPLDPFRIGEEHIIFRDRYLIAINKPSGIETQPTPARYKGTLYEALQVYLADPGRPLDKPSVGMVQRLDRETSGVLVFSIHPRAHGGLTGALAGREVSKSYLALVRGVPDPSEGEIRSQLARSRRDNRMRSVERGGREAVTRYRVVEAFGDAALVEVRILTGRSHQIRVHLAELGHPLLGDRLYGGNAPFRGRCVLRQMLHSRSLVLRHPVEGRDMSFEAPLPIDMLEILEVLRD